MSTRSLVAVETAGKIKATYVHCDGYVTGVGGTLLRHYNNRKAAQAVAKLGYASSLYGTIAETIDGTVAHNRDVKPSRYVGRFDCLSDADGMNVEYVYLFTGGVWLVAVIDGTGHERFRYLETAYLENMAGEAA